jgi:putative oxidoreductase
MTLVRLVARPMLASVFVVQGVQILRNPTPLLPKARPLVDRLRPLLKRVAPQLPTDPVTLVRLNAGAQVGAGLLLATGRFPRPASLVLAASLGPTTAAGHAFWEVEDPAERRQQRIQFLKNVSLAGGLLIAGVDTAGRPGIAWRTRRAARDAKRVALTARREARMATRVATADPRGAVHALRR